MTDSILLREKIKESGLKYKHIAEKLGITTTGLQYKIDNRVQFKADEIATVCNLLGITKLADVNKIFFSCKL